MNQITKYMCTVETKNYPVNTIRPSIQRYASIRKKFTASEIANCLANYASVTLHKTNGSNIKLTPTNFKQVLLTYKNEMINQEERNKMVGQVKKNSVAFEKVKEENAIPAPAPISVEEPTEPAIEVADSESLEEFEVDPEDPETDFSYIDGDDPELEEE